ncbi:MAG: response regulator, partial [Pseudobdellovibrionaceae bacterium]|nr:response regulator [Pseudobdellovibrionaceae bacterium]
MRIEKSQWQWLIESLLIILSLVLGVIDFQSRTGTTVWVLHVILITFGVFTRQPRLPLVLATLASLFMAASILKVPSSTLDSWIGQVSRILGVTTFWASAYIVSKFIGSQLTLEKSDLKAQEISEDLKTVAWIHDGLSKMNDAIRGVQAPVVLCQNFLNQLAEHIGANVGSFYLSDEGCFLRRAAVYAYADNEGMGQTFAPNEGLLGQAGAQQKILELADLPADYYLKIKSSLGSLPPRYIMAVPVLFDGTLRGVFELGSLTPFSTATRTFLSLAPKNIGIAIDLALSRVRLQESLHQSQRFSEEMQVQQEELRALNEEMHEQAKALEASQSKLEMQQTALEESNADLELKQALLEEQKEALQEKNTLLISSKREIELASQYKTEFLSNMSHELRTPLNSILILAQMLANNKANRLSEDEVDSATTIVTAGNDLLSLINDILDLSKIESGKLELNPELVDLGDLTASLERTFRPMADKKRIDFALNVDKDALREVFTDRQRLEQILKNFLSNALKFTQKGHVRLHITRSDDQDKPIAISVSDSGIGIPKDKQEIIFEAFKQADGTTSRRFGGTGLGLSISRDLTFHLQGEIGLQSIEGKGSTFTIYLPVRLRLKDAAPPVPTPASLPRQHRESAQPEPQMANDARSRSHSFLDDRDSIAPGQRSLLIIEDDPSFAHTLSKQVRELGFKCILSEDGELGLADARRYLPNGIILDLKLPGLGGMEVLEQLKKDPKTRHIPVHVVSGMDRKKSALHLGAVGYLMKPVTADSLMEALSKIEAVAAGSLKRVLIVEDNPIQLKSMQGLIAGLKDVESFGASSATEALELLATTAVDCVVLDLSLPDMSGLKMLETMAAEPGGSCPPVVVYTGMDLTREDEQAIRKYTDSIIIKGARSPERLLDEVVLFLHRVESELPAGKQQVLKELRDRNEIFLGAKILLVDDDLRNVFALSRLLDENGAIVTVARNGEEALERLNKSPDQHLVLMDVMMPI